MHSFGRISSGGGKEVREVSLLEKDGWFLARQGGTSQSKFREIEAFVKRSFFR